MLNLDSKVPGLQVPPCSESEQLFATVGCFFDRAFMVRDPSLMHSALLLCRLLAHPTQLEPKNTSTVSAQATTQI